MRKAVFLDAATLGPASLDPIRALCTLECYPTSAPQEALQRVEGCNILIINKVKVTPELLDAAGEGLELVCEAATGVNNIDLEACRQRGVEVRNVAGYSTTSVCQLCFTQILALTCEVRRFDSWCKDGDYSRSGLFTEVSAPWSELSGKTLGIVGMGTIGKKMAAIGEAFGMEVVYFSTSGTSHCSDYPSLPLDELLRRSDVVSIHCPLNARTAGLIGERELGMMKPGALLVNAARGGIVDEAALSAAVGSGSIGGAAVDVFTTEPLPESNPLLHCSRPERLILSPHVAWASDAALERLVRGIADNISGFFSD